MSTDAARAPYEKPEIRIIELKAEEVLAAGCKAPGTPRRFVAGATRPNCGFFIPCSQRGS